MQTAERQGWRHLPQEAEDVRTEFEYAWVAALEKLKLPLSSLIIQ